MVTKRRKKDRRRKRDMNSSQTGRAKASFSGTRIATIVPAVLRHFAKSAFYALFGILFIALFPTPVQAGEEYAGYCWGRPFNPNEYFWVTIQNIPEKTVRCYFKKRPDAGGEIVMGSMSWPKPATKEVARQTCADYIKREGLDSPWEAYPGCGSVGMWHDQDGWYIR